MKLITNPSRQIDQPLNARKTLLSPSYTNLLIRSASHQVDLSPECLDLLDLKPPNQICVLLLLICVLLGQICH
jgi:hypothetical protein